MVTAQSAQLSFKESWKPDLLSGFQVFLIALPLCLGISMASGFPPIAGLVSAIVGGIIVSRISGSHVTIDGPAAGLIVVILHGVDVLGHGDMYAGYRLCLAAIVIAGLMQIAFGLLKVGKFAQLVPVSAVHGMLAAIGIIIIAKQFPIMLGAKVEKGSVLNMIAHIPSYIMDMNPEIALIGGGGILFLIFFNTIKNPKFKIIPAAIIVVGVGALLGVSEHLEIPHVYSLFNHEFSVGPSYLLPLPKEIFSSLAFPDFSQLTNATFWMVTLSIAIVASLESILSAAAVDKLDKLKRKSDLNKDIFAVGVGTTISGLLGGLPMIAEIVRSSANVSNGARTGLANFFHGVFLLLSIVLFAGFLVEIPLAALAALLVFTGYRLASPVEIKKVKSIGFDQFAIFMTTLFFVLAVDLLVGIAAGIVLKFLLHIARGVSPKEVFKVKFATAKNGDDVEVKVHSALIFTNMLPLMSFLEEQNHKGKVKIDLSESSFIDHTALESLHDFRREFANAGGSMRIELGVSHAAHSGHPLAARRLKA